MALAAANVDRSLVHRAGWFSWLWEKPVESCASTPPSSNPSSSMDMTQMNEFGRATLSSVEGDSCRLDRFCQLIAIEPAIHLPRTQRATELVAVIGPDFKTLLEKMELPEGAARKPIEEQWTSLSSKCTK